MNKPLIFGLACVIIYKEYILSLGELRPFGKNATIGLKLPICMKGER